MAKSHNHPFYGEQNAVQKKVYFNIQNLRLKLLITPKLVMIILDKLLAGHCQQFSTVTGLQTQGGFVRRQENS